MCRGSNYEQVYLYGSVQWGNLHFILFHSVWILFIYKLIEINYRKVSDDEPGKSSSWKKYMTLILDEIAGNSVQLGVGVLYRSGHDGLDH